MRFKAIIAIILMGITSFALADNNWQVDVHLNDIVAEKLSEKRGDEIYLYITEYLTTKQGKRHKEHRVPTYPKHWLSKHLAELSDILLWQVVVSENEQAEIVFSLIEHDVPPFNSDDALGSVQLTVKNVDGRLQQQWGVTEFKQPISVREIENNRRNFKKATRFQMSGAESSYEIGFYTKLKELP